jgi:hypothetical protein
LTGKDLEEVKEALLTSLDGHGQTKSRSLTLPKAQGFGMTMLGESRISTGPVKEGKEVRDKIPWELGDRGRGVGVGREKESRDRREWSLANTGQNSRK